MSVGQGEVLGLLLGACADHCWHASETELHLTLPFFFFFLGSVITLCLYVLFRARYCLRARSKHFRSCYLSLIIALLCSVSKATAWGQSYGPSGKDVSCLA